MFFHLRRNLSDLTVFSEQRGLWAILGEFLPQPLSEEELRALVEKAITESGANSISDMGRVMSVLMPLIRGKADGKEANQIVRELLGGG